MARRYRFVSHICDTVEGFATADAALGAGRAFVLGAMGSQGFTRIVEHRCEDGTLFFGGWSDIEDLKAVAWVDELGR